MNNRTCSGIFFGVVSIILAACANITPGAAPTATLGITLTPFHTSTVTPSLSPTPPGTSTPLPSPTPTPRTYTVRMGDDLGGIAFRFGVSLDQLITANPKINPSVLIVGNVLIIPPSAKPNPTAQAAAPVVTPVPVDLSQPVCYSDQEKNLTCFSLAHNSLQNSLENIVVDFRRIDTDSGSIFTQRAYAPLDQVLPGANLPLMVVFPSPIPSHFATSVELVTSLPSPQDDTRYLPIQLSNQKTIITSDRLSAQVNGQMQLKNGEKSARRVWLLATAYGSGQQVVGFYRWQLSGTLATGQNQTYQFSVYSVGPGIDHVDLIAEALP